MQNNILISPLQKHALSAPVVHKEVLSKIYFELPDRIGDDINFVSGYYWNYEVGFGNCLDFNDACSFIHNLMMRRRILFPFNNVVKIVNIMFDFVEQISGATSD